MPSRPTVADVLAIAALVLAVIAAIGGLFIGYLYRDTAEMVRQARATDLVTLVVAAPALAIGLWRARAGSVAGRLVAIAALGYLAYSYAIYGFSVVIDPLTPAHIAILGLSTWSLVLAVLGMGATAQEGARSMPLPRLIAGGFLIVVAVLFALLWLGRSAAPSPAARCRRQ